MTLNILKIKKMKKNEFINAIMDELQIVVSKGVVVAINNSLEHSAVRDIVRGICNYSDAVNYGRSIMKEPYKNSLNWLELSTPIATVENVDRLKRKLRTMLSDIWYEMDFPAVIQDGVYNLNEIEVYEIEV